MAGGRYDEVRGRFEMIVDESGACGVAAGGMMGAELRLYAAQQPDR
jgi:hypothetical protein